MITQILIIVDEFDETVASDVDDVIAGIESLNQASFIITDNLETAISALESKIEKGVIH